MMFSSRSAAVGFLAVLAVGLAGCGRSLFQGKHAAEENVSPDIPGAQFKTIATIAGGDGRTNLRMSADVRMQLTQAGITAVARAGRWESEQAAIAEICGPTGGSVDGVLVVAFDRLRLMDCRTNKVAYDILHDPQAGGPGIQGLTQKLLRYLRGETQGTKSSAPK